ncbi:MAG: FHA domain-containing protein [Myxococcaceae bacterium]|nr:FHA domain-containing protein [Myxococcaceae bacterium]
MKLEITVEGETTTADLGQGTFTVGGSAQDAIQIASLPEAFLELRIDGDRLMVKGSDTFTVDEVLSPPGVSRLVLAGERIGLADGISLRQVPEEPGAVKGTSAVLMHLMSDFEDPAEARCATLTCLTGLDVGRRYAMVGDVAELGRGDDVHMRIRDRAVSRRHARLRRVANGFTIEDLQSPNGVFVNGKKVHRQAPLEDGAVIELGHSLLRFRAPKEEPPPEPPPPPEEALAEAEATPSPPSAEPPDSPPQKPKRARSKLELALIGLGVALALVGVVVSFGIASGPGAPAKAAGKLSAPTPAPHVR